MNALVVEYDPLLRPQLEQALRERGHRVTLCADADAAWQAFLKERHQLVLLDDRLQGVDVTDLCRRMRQQTAASPCLFLLLTDRKEPEELQAIVDAGADDYLFRPVSLQQLRIRLVVIERQIKNLEERNQMDLELRELVERFDLAARGSNDGLWDGKIIPPNPWYSPQTQVWYSPRLKQLLGFEDHEFPDVLASWADRLHPEDHARVFHALANHMDHRVPYDVDYRIKTKSGEYRWFSGRGEAIWDAQGHPLRMAGSLRDITGRKQTEEALRSKQRMLRQLLDINERDRRLVAYEIHDGLVQYVTGALMHLEAFALRQGAMSAAAHKEFDEALSLLRDSVAEARRLISGLRPPILDEMGVVPAIESLIDEMQRSSEIPIEFAHDVQFDRLASALESAIFRIVQEALNNVRQHSQSNRARVELRQVGDQLRLEIRDWGVGFDPLEVHEERYGLQGIRERARLLQGTTLIESAPEYGTRVFVELPVLAAELLPPIPDSVVSSPTSNLPR